MLRLFPLFIGLILLTLACAVLQPPPAPNDVLFSVGEQPVTVEEFSYVYEKNNFNNDSIYTKSDIDAYLQLFVNFKLKVLQAQAEGYDTLPAFTSEFETYKQQLAKPYLTETRINEQLTRQAYERMKEEIHAAHILIRLPKDPQPEDTLVAYNKIEKILKEALSGKDFAQLASTYSEDPSAQRNGGDLGYFTVFQMVFPFEEAAYNTPVGEISGIIRTQFGYHILKILDRRPSLGKVKVAHIMVRTNNQGDTTEAINKIFEIHDQLMAGVDWNYLCRQFSEDDRTKNNGGSLPYLATGQVDPAFAEAAFGLREVGDISDPFSTPYGMHIIKLEDRQQIPLFEEAKSELETKVRRDSRSEINKQVLIQKLKNQHHFKEDPTALDYALSRADSNLVQGKWDFNDQQTSLKDTLFTIENNKYSIEDLFIYARSKQRRRINISPMQYMSDLHDSYVEQCLVDYELEHLKVENAEYRLLLNEYYEGILLFNIMEHEVWSRASSDSVGLMTFYDNNKNDFQWDERLEATIYDAAEPEIIEEIKNRYTDVKYIGIDSTLISKMDEIKPAVSALAQKYPSLTDRYVYLLYGENEVAIKDSISGFISSAMPVPEGHIIQKMKNSLSGAVAVILKSRSKKSLEILYNRESALNLQVVEGKFEKDDHPALGESVWEPGVHEIQKDQRFYLVDVDKILAPKPKALDEVKGLVISRYQDYLEENWIEELRKKYPVVINEKVLKKIYKEFEAKIPVDR